MRRIRQAAALCAMGAALFGCAASSPRPPAQPPAVRQFRHGLEVMDTYLAWYESVGRRLAANPDSVAAEEREKFLAVGKALVKMSKGLNMAVGNRTDAADPAAR